MACQDAADDPPLDGELQSLREPHRQRAPLFDGLEIGVRHFARAQRAGEPIGGGDRILHRHVDANAADRRHRVRRVADADQSGPPPFLQPIDGDAEQLDVVPGFQFAGCLNLCSAFWASDRMPV